MNRTLRILLPLVVLIAGAAGAAALIATKKKPTRVKKAPLPPKVEVVQLRTQSAPAGVEALGTLVPSKTLTLQPEVSGRVVFVNESLVPGGTIAKGEVLVRIDSREFKLALEERKAALAKAEFDLAVEQGRARVAEREWKLVGADNKGPEAAGRALALREPHLANARANVAGAQAGVERAQLNVSRTVLRAPFDLLVREESVELGQIVNPQSRLATLVGTESFWVQTSVPVSALRWIRTAADGQASSAVVRESLGEGATVAREGEVLRVLGELDGKGQMARLLVGVPDPLGLRGQGGSKLLLGAYVRVSLAGKSLDDVYVVPRIALRQGDVLWIADAQGKLRIRKTQPVWSNEREIYLRDGVQAGDRVIVSRIAAPVDGMALRVAGASEPTAKAEGGKQP